MNPPSLPPPPPKHGFQAAIPPSIDFGTSILGGGGIPNDNVCLKWGKKDDKHLSNTGFSIAFSVFVRLGRLSKPLSRRMCNNLEKGFDGVE